MGYRWLYHPSVPSGPFKIGQDDVLQVLAQRKKHLRHVDVRRCELLSNLDRGWGLITSKMQGVLSQESVWEPRVDHN